VHLEDLRANAEVDSSPSDFLNPDFAEANTVSVDAEREMEKLADRIETYEGFEKQFNDELMAMDVEYNPGVMNVYMRAINTADLSRNIVYKKERCDGPESRTFCDHQDDERRSD